MLDFLFHHDHHGHYGDDPALGVYSFHHDHHGHHGDDLAMGTHGAEHFHLSRHSHAVDSDNDGFSNAVEAHLHTNPFDPHSHPHLEASWLSHGHHHHRHERDSDHDGFPDSIEHMMGTDPFSAASHPDMTLAHHFPEGSDLNLPGTADLAPHSSLDWHLP